MKPTTMQQQNVRPISTYDNLTASSSAPARPKMKQQQQQLEEKHQQEQPQWASAGTAELAARLGGSSGPDANGTSHSIAAVKAALSDAKSKFFGIHSCETNENRDAQVTAAPDVKPAAASSASSASAPAAAAAAASNKPEPKYQNVPQPTRQRTASPAASSTPTVVAQRFGATYEQIPLCDLDAVQPTQAVYMSTTVPQNMKGMKIAGRHTPTRNSLRHSRMIVVNNKNHDSIQDTYTTHIRHSNLSRQLLILQLVIGLLIVGLAISILIRMPRASILINPYLSGLSLVLASIAGLILLGRDRGGSEYKRAHNNCYKVLLIESYVFSALALIFCCLALVCAAIEFAELQSMSTQANGTCGPATSSLLNYSNCTCLSDEQTALVANTTTAEPGDENALNNDTDDDSCEALRGKWKYLLAFSIALNALGIFSTFLYITIFICCQHSRRKHFNISV